MSEARKIHVRVTHVDPLVSAGLLAILSRCDDMVASNASDQPTSEGCDVLISDHVTAVRLAGLSKSSHPAPIAKVVAVTDRDREWDVCVAMKAGVDGYLLQRENPSHVVDAVRAVCANRRYVSVEVAPKLADGLMRDELTLREMEVLSAMSTGASNKAISNALGISGGTVKSHVRNILSKVGACARTEAVVIAAQRGLTSD